MADISLIEVIFYGFLELISITMLILSVIKEAPLGKSSSIVRSIYMLPGIISSGILGMSGPNIIFQTASTVNTIKSINTTQVWTEATTQTNLIPLQNPMWQTFHFMIMVTLVVYVIIQVVILLTKHE